MATQLQTEQGIVRVPSGTWMVDPSHSSVSFEVRHMMIATVRGRFREFEGTIMAAEDLAESRVAGKANVTSIDTGQTDRALALCGLLRCRALRRHRVRVETDRACRGRDVRVVGDLTIKDHTHEISVATVVQGA